MTKVFWRPIKSDCNNPKKSGEYLITHDGGYHGKLEVGIDYFDADTECWVNILDRHIIAWAEKPEPYQPEQEDNHPDALTAKKYVEGDPETVKALTIFDEE